MEGRCHPPCRVKRSRQIAVRHCARVRCIENEEAILAIVNDAKAGDVLRLNVIREKRPLTLELKLERRSL